MLQPWERSISFELLDRCLPKILVNVLELCDFLGILCFLKPPPLPQQTGDRVAARAVTCQASTCHTGFLKKTDEKQWTLCERLNWTLTDSQSGQTPS